MIARLKEFFRKKDKVMVARIRIGLPFVTHGYEGGGVVVVYKCYETEKGKRSFKVADHGQGMITVRGTFYDWIKEWKTGRPCVKRSLGFNFPTYSEIKAGAKPYTL